MVSLKFRDIPKNYTESWRRLLLKLSPHHVKDPDNFERSLQHLLRKESESIKDLRATFNERRETISPKLLSTHKKIFTYLLGFHLPNATRLLGTWQRLEERWDLSALLPRKPKAKASTNSEEVPPPPRLLLWDFGAGSGAMSQLLYSLLKPHFEETRAYLYDSNSLLLEAAKDFFAFYKELDKPKHPKDTDLEPHLRIYPRKVPLQELNTRPSISDSDLVMVCLGYIWNELSSNSKARGKILEFIVELQRGGKKALIFLIEPGRDFTARAAMMLRDELVDMGLKVLYPCPHDQPCPMLLRSKDWCYSEFPSQVLPKEAQLVDKHVSMERSLLAASTYVFATDAAYKQLGPSKSAKKEVIVGRPLLDQDTRSYEDLLCSPEGELLKKEPQLPEKREEGAPRKKPPFLRGEMRTSTDLS
ncbi:MAG: hypothetical protein KA436_04545 [Oligoflexales bacterium]|nr:hypothetical protein [Oligoflexales bacterium]